MDSLRSLVYGCFGSVNTLLAEGPALSRVGGPVLSACPKRSRREVEGFQGRQRPPGRFQVSSPLWAQDRPAGLGTSERPLGQNVLNRQIERQIADIAQSFAIHQQIEHLTQCFIAGLFNGFT